MTAGLTLTVTPEQVEQMRQTGVLLVTMPGEPFATSQATFPHEAERVLIRPPDLLVEVAKPCENWGHDVPDDPDDPCPDCHNGKRRIEARVSCCTNQVTCRDFSREHCAWRTDGSADGLVTVGIVVHQWGPLVVVGFGINAGGHEYVRLSDGDIYSDLPPGVDPASLVGQYAAAFEVLP